MSALNIFFKDNFNLTFETFAVTRNKKCFLLCKLDTAKKNQNMSHKSISVLAVCKEQHSVIEFVHTVSTLLIFTSWNYYMKIIKEKETD
jgi:hypothetical protein